MPASFNPDHLVPAVSLNRVRIVDLPVIVLDASMRDRLSYDLLSTQALAGQIRACAADLGLEHHMQVRDAKLPALLDQCFASSEQVVRSTAEAIATRAGQALGVVLMTLKRGDSVNRAARTDWDDSYWDYWHNIRQVILGGGLVSGHLGQRILVHAQTLLTEQHTDCTLKIAAYPALLPLIGAARSLPIDNGSALVCDYGQSRIKRACAIFEDGLLVALRVLPTTMMDWTVLDHHPVEHPDRAVSLARSMAQSIQSTLGEFQRHGQHLAPVIGISVASYIADGRPLPRQGGPYAEMHMLDLPLERWLAARLSEQAGEPVTLTLLHDGTAAARAVGEATAGAVIMLGTALGIGFPRGARSIRSVSPRFSVTPH